jgi:hypothetical protein
VCILSLFDNTAGVYTPRVQVLRTWDSSLSVCSSVSLRGDILVVADSRNRAAVANVHSPEDRVVILESTTISDHPQTVSPPPPPPPPPPPAVESFLMTPTVEHLFANSGFAEVHISGSCKVCGGV